MIILISPIESFF